MNLTFIRFFTLGVLMFIAPVVQALEIQPFSAGVQTKAKDLDASVLTLGQMACGNLLIAKARPALTKAVQTSGPSDQQAAAQEASSLFTQGWALREFNRASWETPLNAASFSLFHAYKQSTPGHEEAIAYCQHQVKVWKESGQLRLTEEQMARVMGKLQIELGSLGK